MGSFRLFRGRITGGCCLVSLKVHVPVDFYFIFLYLFIYLFYLFLLSDFIQFETIFWSSRPPLALISAVSFWYLVQYWYWYLVYLIVLLLLSHLRRLPLLFVTRKKTCASSQTLTNLQRERADEVTRKIDSLQVTDRTLCCVKLVCVYNLCSCGRPVCCTTWNFSQRAGEVVDLGPETATVDTQLVAPVAVRYTHLVFFSRVGLVRPPSFAGGFGIRLSSVFCHRPRVFL